MGRRNGVVTWSPVVVSVSRPSKKMPARKNLMRSSVSFQQRRIDGTFDGHFRGDTHSLLLSMRENGHRKLQLLIDLPNKQVRRIYDGRRSWNFGSSGDPCELDCQLGTVVWEDGEVRDIDSRGFRLDWLHGRHTLRAFPPCALPVPQTPAALVHSAPPLSAAPLPSVHFLVLGGRPR